MRLGTWLNNMFWNVNTPPNYAWLLFPQSHRRKPKEKCMLTQCFIEKYCIGKPLLGHIWQRWSGVSVQWQLKTGLCSLFVTAPLLMTKLTVGLSEDKSKISMRPTENVGAWDIPQQRGPDILTMLAHLKGPAHH